MAVPELSSIYDFLMMFWAFIVYILLLSCLGYMIVRGLERFKLYRLERKIKASPVTCFTTGSRLPADAMLVATSLVVSESLIETIMLLPKRYIGGEIEHRSFKAERCRRHLLAKIKLQAMQLDCGEIHNIRFYSSELSQRIKTPLGEKGLMEIMVVGMAVPNRIHTESLVPL